MHVSGDRIPPEDNPSPCRAARLQGNADAGVRLAELDGASQTLRLFHESHAAQVRRRGHSRPCGFCAPVALGCI